MQIEELWEKMQVELESIKKQVNKIPEIEKQVSKIPGIEKEVSKIPNIETKLDIMTNVNLAQILKVQTEMRKELNDKLDNYIIKNEVDHRKFEYEIAKIKMENKVAK